MAHATLLLGDCREELTRLEPDTVDLVVTSPPYADQRASTYGGIKPDDYVEWFLPTADQLHRVLKPEGTFVLNIKERVVKGERHTYVNHLILEMRKRGWLWTEQFIWRKTNCYPGKWPNRFRDAWERLLQFNKSRDFRMNAPEPGATNVLEGATECGNRGHSAAFPYWLPAWAIDQFTGPGDLVLDPFMGSGTTVRAALDRGRNAVGIEIHEPYYRKALEELEDGKMTGGYLVRAYHDGRIVGIQPASDENLEEVKRQAAEKMTRMAGGPVTLSVLEMGEPHNPDAPLERLTR